MAEFHYCFNTSTIRGQKLSLVEEIDIVAQAGYTAIEPWINEIEAYVKQGGSLPDLKKRISDLRAHRRSAIGFAEWIVDDDARRTKGLEHARRDMDLVQQIGGNANRRTGGWRDGSDQYRLPESGRTLPCTPGARRPLRRCAAWSRSGDFRRRSLGWAKP